MIMILVNVMLIKNKFNTNTNSNTIKFKLHQSLIFLAALIYSLWLKIHFFNYYDSAHLSL